MKLKLDENGHVVVQDGKPVYIHDDGKEHVLDAPALINRVNNLTSESERYKTQVTELTEKSKPYEGLDPDEARNAIETLKSIDQKKLKDAGEIELVKQQIAETFEADKKAMGLKFEKAESDFKTQLAAKDKTIYNLMVSSKFATSPYFSGEKPKTILPPDMAAEYFGKYFEIQGEGETARVVGKINGTVIPSREKYGEPAGFEEAIGVIIENYPAKERILTASPGGPASSGNFSINNNGIKVIKRGDSAAFASNLEAIAKGEVRVE